MCIHVWSIFKFVLQIQMSVPVIMVAVLKIAIILMEATTAPVMEDTP